MGKVMADYVMVKPATKGGLSNSNSPKGIFKALQDRFSKAFQGANGVPKCFDKAATKWVTEFNGSKVQEVLSLKHHCVSAYDTKAVFSISNPAADVHMTAVGQDKIQEQWKAVRGLGCHQITKATGRKVTPVDATTLIQSYDHVEFSDRSGKYTMAIQILAEVWKLQDGQWKVLADYVMVKPAAK